MSLGESIENSLEPLIGFGHKRLLSIGSGIVFQSLDGGDPRILCKVFDVLADAIEELLHTVVDLANFTAAAIQEIGLRRAPQVQYDEYRDQNHRKAGDGGKYPCQLLFDIHDFFRCYF
ncbi:hypothetical protein D3C71_1601540 [compost metagenome]